MYAVIMKDEDLVCYKTYKRADSASTDSIHQAKGAPSEAHSYL